MPSVAKISWMLPQSHLDPSETKTSSGAIRAAARRVVVLRDGLRRRKRITLLGPIALNVRDWPSRRWPGAGLDAGGGSGSVTSADAEADERLSGWACA